jgi:hypothetical protein
MWGAAVMVLELELELELGLPGPGPRVSPPVPTSPCKGYPAGSPKGRGSHMGSGQWAVGTALFAIAQLEDMSLAISSPVPTHLRLPMG